MQHGPYMKDNRCWPVLVMMQHGPCMKDNRCWPVLVMMQHGPYMKDNRCWPVLVMKQDGPYMKDNRWCVDLSWYWCKMASIWRITDVMLTSLGNDATWPLSITDVDLSWYWCKMPLYQYMMWRHSQVVCVVVVAAVSGESADRKYPVIWQRHCFVFMISPGNKFNPTSISARERCREREGER